MEDGESILWPPRRPGGGLVPGIPGLLPGSPAPWDILGDPIPDQFCEQFSQQFSVKKSSFLSSFLIDFSVMSGASGTRHGKETLKKTLT